MTFRVLVQLILTSWGLFFSDSILLAQTKTFPMNAIEAKPSHVRLYLRPLKKSHLSPKRKAALIGKWKKGCKRLAEAMQVRNGLWEHGIFKSYGCYDPKNLVEGEQGTQFNGWIVELIEKSSSSELRLRYFGSDRTYHHYATVKLLSLQSSLKVLQDPQAAAILAVRLLAEAPMAKTVMLPLEDTQMRVQMKGDQARLLPPPSAYKIFTLKPGKEQYGWVMDEIGTATLGLEEAKPSPPPVKPKPTKPKDDDNDGEPDFWSDFDATLDGESSDKGKEKKWQPSHTRPAKGNDNLHDWGVKISKTAEIDARETYWAQVTDQKEVIAVADAALIRSFDRLGLGFETVGTVWDKVPSGYLGARYGHPMTKSKDVIGKTPIVGVLAEMRDGSFEGLRWYWDFAPETKVMVQGRETSLTWSRPTLGWSFGLDFNNPFLRRVDVVPKYGILNLDAKLPVSTPDPNRVLILDFRARNTSNFGLEIGAESAMHWFLIRLWGATDVAGVAKSTSTSVSFLRGGLDAYWDITQLSQNYDLSLLFFTVAEKVQLTRNLKRDIEDTTLETNGVTYLQIFSGIGLTVGW